jgi:hypothetical protein
MPDVAMPDAAMPDGRAAHVAMPHVVSRPMGVSDVFGAPTGPIRPDSAGFGRIRTGIRPFLPVGWANLASAGSTKAQPVTYAHPRGMGAIGMGIGPSGKRYQDGAGDGADDGPGEAGTEPARGRIASIWAIARASVIGAGTTDRIAPSGPMKNWVGNP